MRLDHDKCRRARQRLAPERVEKWTPLERLAVDTHLKYCGPCAIYWLRLRGERAVASELTATQASVVQSTARPRTERSRVLLAPQGVEMGHPRHLSPVSRVLDEREPTGDLVTVLNWRAGALVVVAFCLIAALLSLMVLAAFPHH